MNKVMFLARLTKDIELKTSGNTAFAKFSIAVNRRFKKDGEANADFFNCTAFGKTAEFCGSYLKKGSQIVLEGRLQNNNWTDSDGKKRYDVAVIAENIYFADSKQDKKPDDGFTVVEDDGELPF